MKRSLKINICRAVVAALLLITVPGMSAGKQHTVTIMGIGDSITEGGAAFTSYVYPLWEMLMQGGYTQCEFIGPKQSACRTGNIRHCGYSGKNVEYLESLVDSVYSRYPADIVLLHAGHNHFVEEKPVAGMMKSYRHIVDCIHGINPKCTVVIAKVITSGKLPKYSYIPELNDSIEQWVNRCGSKRLRMVDMAEGWDWKTMTIHDHVHPNAKGAGLMASKWYAMLAEFMDAETYTRHVSREVYGKSKSGRDLALTIYQGNGKPEQARNDKPSKCMLFLFAGGWKYGTPLQYVRECGRYSKKGYVTIGVDYSVSSLDKSSEKDSYADVCKAYKWVVEHADSLGIDPGQIYLWGSSAGATMAAVMARDTQVFPKPKALVLNYPVLGKVKASDRFFGVGEERTYGGDFPPCLLIYGDKDKYTSPDEVSEYYNEMLAKGRDVTLKMFANQGHPVFRYRQPDYKIMNECMRVSDRFLKKH